MTSFLFFSFYTEQLSIAALIVSLVEEMWRKMSRLLDEERKRNEVQKKRALR